MLISHAGQPSPDCHRIRLILRTHRADNLRLGQLPRFGEAPDGTDGDMQPFSHFGARQQEIISRHRASRFALASRYLLVTPGSRTRRN
jgi:hypothetical protein